VHVLRAMDRRIRTCALPSDEGLCEMDEGEWISDGDVAVASCDRVPDLSTQSH
jgi:hypothetical protein